MDKRKPPESEVQIVDLQRYRKNKNEEKRREYERVLFNRILGVYSFAEKHSLTHIEVVDISYSGLKFREENPEKPLRAEEKVALRFYFTPSSYLKVIVDVKRAIPFKEEDREGMEYGCQLDKATKSYEVIRELIAFMYRYSETACQDTNPPMIWF